MLFSLKSYVQIFHAAWNNKNKIKRNVAVVYSFISCFYNFMVFHRPNKHSCISSFPPPASCPQSLDDFRYPKEPPLPALHFCRLRWMIVWFRCQNTSKKVIIESQKKRELEVAFFAGLSKGFQIQCWITFIAESVRALTEALLKKQSTSSYLKNILDLNQPILAQ